MKTKAILYLLALVIAILVSSCGKKGCTDGNASNYDWEAKKDDGTCEYLGCTDRNGLNFNPSAKTDDGSCNYYGKVQFFTSVDTDAGDYVSVVFNDTLSFILNGNCPASLMECGQTDSDNCFFIEISNLVPGVYPYEATSYEDGVTRVFPTSYITVVSNGCEMELLGY